VKSRPDVIDIFLQPGDFFVGDGNYRVRTLLGSCVSVTLWHGQKRIGAMSHYLLSERPNGATCLDSRYGADALQMMLDELARMRVAAAECKAKIFGGGDMFPSGPRDRLLRVGFDNGETARQLLRQHRIPIVAESLYGEGHRQILFDIATGDVWSRQVKPVAAREHGAATGADGIVETPKSARKTAKDPGSLL